MGMDVYGKKPKSDKGNYFQNNIWWWPPLWRYCEFLAPELCAKVEHSHSNDGDGLSGEDSAILSKILLNEVASGRTAEYSKEFKEYQQSLPTCGPCEHCNQTGQYDDKICSWCEGKGQARVWEVAYHFDVENVSEFALFLRDCGGFEIW